MEQTGSRLNVFTRDDVTVAEFNDRRILDEMNINEIGRRLKALAATIDPPKIVLDFANVAHMSSSALGMLISLRKQITERNGELRLAGIQPAILEVFAITRLDEIFAICPTRKEALDTLQ